jgi:hypothetical protein
MNDSFYTYRPVLISKVGKLSWLFGLLLLLTVLRMLLYELFDEYIVEKTIGSVYRSRLSYPESLICFAAMFFGLYSMVLNIVQTRYILRLRYILLAGLTLLFYLYERFYNDKYIFTALIPSDSWVVIKFLDLPFLLLGLTLASLLVNRFRKKNIVKTQNDLLTDLPLSSREDDKFNREYVYETLIKQIADIRPKNSKSFCVGIVNKWAEGKTSFLNFIEQELNNEKDKTLLIKFNAWFTPKSENLTTDFFKTFDDTLSRYIYTGALVRNYAKSLTQLDSVLNPAKYLPQNWVDQPSNQNYFDRISNLLIKLDKRIFIIIDDIDRLDNEEVFEVLRMIRNSANFPNTVFLVPFDKSYAMHALTEKKIYNPHEYLKKIFDVEVSLTPIHESYLQPVFLQVMRNFITNKLALASKEDIDFLEGQLLAIFESRGIQATKAKYQAIDNTVFKILRNNRDIIRFTNSVKLSLKENFSKFYLPDLLILELIKYQDLELYKRLLENRRYLAEHDEGGRKVLKLVGEPGSDKDESLINFLIAGDDKEDIFDRKNEGETENKTSKSAKNDNWDNPKKITEKNLEELVRALYMQPDQNDYRANLSIYYQVNFLNYVQYNVGGISYDKLDELIDG